MAKFKKTCRESIQGRNFVSEKTAFGNTTDLASKNTAIFPMNPSQTVIHLKIDIEPVN